MILFSCFLFNRKKKKSQVWTAANWFVLEGKFFFFVHHAEALHFIVISNIGSPVFVDDVLHHRVAMLGARDYSMVGTQWCILSVVNFCGGYAAH